MKRALLILATLCSLIGGAHAQGTIPVAMNIQSDANGRPMARALLYLFVVGTVATPQIAFQDVDLTQALPWPIPADQVGRLPMFYLPAGSVHARLTDAAGLVQFDYPNVLVIGGTPASTGGGGGGPTVDPTAIATTGDIKFKLTSETLSGWVILNANSIGNATSGASGLASATTQALFVYLWTQCSQQFCPVAPGGRGATALADYNASKRLQLPDMRGYMPTGRDCMGAGCAGRIPNGNIAIGVNNDTANSAGGAANVLITLNYLPSLLLPFATAYVPAGQGSHFHTYTFTQASAQGSSGGTGLFLGTNIAGTNTSAVDLPQMNVQGSALLAGSGNLLPNMSPFKLGTFYIKL